MKRRFFWTGAGLFLLNLALVAPLLLTERTPHHASIEGAFIGLARFLSVHPDPFGWYPYWYCGTPIQFTYTPGLHYLNAAVIRLLPMISAGQAYHAVAAVLYSLGAATVAFLVYSFTRRRRWAFGAGLLYTFWSPAIWLAGGIRQNLPRLEVPWRLQILIEWGEGPHTASLLLIPLVIVALWKTVEQKRFPPLFAAASLMAAVVLMNWVGAFALGGIFLCFLLTVIRLPGAARAVWAGVLAWLLAAWWITPSFVRVVAFNAQSVSGHYEYRLGMIPLIAGALLGLALIRWLFRAVPARPYLCFLALATFFFGYLTLNAYWFGLYMIPQPHRYLPEFEMFLILLVCELLRGAGRRAMAIALAALAVAVLVQSRRFLTRPYRTLRPAAVEHWTEYQIARWLSDHADRDGRVYIIGSEGMSLNQWADVAQAKGWFDPGVRGQLLLHISHQVSSGQNAPPGRDGAIAVDLLKAIGARYAVVHGPRSPVGYSDFPRPGKFDGLLPEVYRLGPEQAIYEVPGVRLAHLVRRDELPSSTPINGLDLAPMARYIAAVADPARAALRTRWLEPASLEVRGEFPPETLVSLRVSHADGWRAWQGSRRIPVERDHLGFLVLAPAPDRDGHLRLHYAGSLEQRAGGWISLLTLAACLVRILPRPRRPQSKILPPP